MRFLNTSLGAISVAMFLLSIDAWAQGMPRRDRSGSPRDTQATRDKAAATPSSAGEPFSALERELPSLEVDLQVRSDQLESWRLFSRDVRDLAEMDRARRKHMTALRDMGERPPTAISFVGALVEDERLKSEAAQDLKRHLDVLYAQLDDMQKRTLDRRLVQSQTEPLGR